MSDDYTEREMRIIHERDAALTRAETAEHNLREALGLIVASEAWPYLNGGDTGKNQDDVATVSRLQAWVDELGAPKPRAVITLTDGDEEGEVSCSIEFIPPVLKDERGTPAQMHALDMLNASLSRAKKHTEPKVRSPRKKR